LPTQEDLKIIENYILRHSFSYWKRIK